MFLQLPLADPLFPWCQLPPADGRLDVLLFSAEAATPFFPGGSFSAFNLRSKLPIDYSKRSLANLLCLIASPGNRATDFAPPLVSANVGGPACCAMCPSPATAKCLLLIRKQPKQNLPDLGGFIRKLLETLH